jgi:hypothetical protein
VLVLTLNSWSGIFNHQLHQDTNSGTTLQYHYEILFENRGEKGVMREYNGGSKLVQSTLYASLKFLQCNSLGLLIIPKIKKKKYK